MKTEIDNDMKLILEALKDFPDGIGVNKLYEKLKDERGRYLMSKPTYTKKLQKLKDMGLVTEEVDGEWKRGKRKILKLKNSGKIIATELSKIKRFKKIFEKFIEFELSKVTTEDKTVAYLRLTLAESEIMKKLTEEKERIFNSNLSKDFKKDLLFEIVETEKEIEKLFIDACLKKPELHKIYSTVEYTKNLNEKDLIKKILNYNFEDRLIEELKLKLEDMGVCGEKRDAFIREIENIIKKMPKTDYQSLDVISILKDVKSKLKELEKKI